MSDIYYLKESKRSYPEGDFISEKYDSEELEDLKRVIILVSTPRSGSTFVCDQLYSVTRAIGHEYFQPHGYLQFLAKRWGCFLEGGIDKNKFIHCLIRKRSKSGVLIINLHASHLDVFKHFVSYFPEVEVRCIHLIRGDILSQAVSFYIASSTGEWSYVYKKTNKNKLKYSYEEIKKKADKIAKDNLYATCFLKKIDLNYKIAVYENLHIDISDIAFYALDKAFYFDKKNNIIKKQATEFNDYLSKFFASDYIEKSGL